MSARGARATAAVPHAEPRLARVLAAGESVGGALLAGAKKRKVAALCEQQQEYENRVRSTREQQEAYESGMADGIRDGKVGPENRNTTYAGIPGDVYKDQYERGYVYGQGFKKGRENAMAKFPKREDVYLTNPDLRYDHRDMYIDGYRNGFSQNASASTARMADVIA